MTRKLVWSSATFALMAAVSAAMAQPADRIRSGGLILAMNDKAMHARAVAELACGSDRPSCRIGTRRFGGGTCINPGSQ
jgi:hypothetical protein